MSDKPHCHQNLTIARHPFPSGGRPPACAGTWYPDDPELLRQMADCYLQTVPARPGAGEVVALIVRHTGYRYSGQVAASAFAQLRERRIDRVLLLGPDHRVSDRISRFDLEGLARDLVTGRSEACGGGALVLAMLWVQRSGADSAEVLGYANSGDVSGDRSAVVGYLAAALTRKAG